MITLDHIGLPARDNQDAARHLAHILGAGYHGPDLHFAPVHVNTQLTLDFCTAERVECLHSTTRWRRGACTSAPWTDTWSKS